MAVCSFDFTQLSSLSEITLSAMLKLALLWADKPEQLQFSAMPVFILEILFIPWTSTS